MSETERLDSLVGSRSNSFESSGASRSPVGLLLNMPEHTIVYLKLSIEEALYAIVTHTWHASVIIVIHNKNVKQGLFASGDCLVVVRILFACNDKLNTRIRSTVAMIQSKYNDEARI